MAKMKSHDLKGIQFHNQRERESKTNPDIDKEKTKDNYDLVNAENINYNERVKEIIESQKTGTRKTRKDAVRVNEFIITSNRGFFDKLSPQDEKRFFEESLKFFSERYGKQNIAYATVHVDEKTPHMHLGVVPMRDGKLQGKNIFNRQELLWLQNEFPKYIQKKEFDLRRGEEGSKVKHLGTIRYKIEQTKKQIEDKKKELLAVSEKLPNNGEIKIRVKGKEVKTTVTPKMFGKPEIVEKETENFVVTPKELKNMKEVMNAAYQVKEDYERLQKTDLVRENKRLREENKELSVAVDRLYDDWQEVSAENRQLKEKNKVLTARISDLKAEIKFIYQSVREFVKERTTGLRAFRDVFKGLVDKVTQKAPGGEFERAHKREMTREYDKGL